jgi:alkyldihydroxyacetonephosphate synthase
MVLGSEGILGVITEAWMRIRPIPRWRGSATMEFAEWDAAVAAIREIAQSGLYPANCRLLDKGEARLHGVSMTGNHLLLLGFESAHHEITDALAMARSVAESHGGTCPQGSKIRDRGDAASGSAGQWKQAFFEAPYLASTLADRKSVV